LSIAVCLLAIEELASIRRKHDPEAEISLKENYETNKKMASCYRRLLDFLIGDSLTQEEKAEQIVMTMIAEFKCLVFYQTNQAISF
jgi:hypothetical protein